MCVRGCESCFLLRRLSSFLREEERGGWGEAYFFTPLSSPAVSSLLSLFLSLFLSLLLLEERAREEMKFSSPAVLSFVCPRESILLECEIIIIIIIIIIIARGTTRGASIEKRGEEMRFDDAKKRPRVASFVLLLLFSRVIISTCSVLTFLLEHTASA